LSKKEEADGERRGRDDQPRDDFSWERLKLRDLAPFAVVLLKIDCFLSKQ
jgi:hypothetical protein